MLVEGLLLVGKDSRAIYGKISKGLYFVMGL